MCACFAYVEVHANPGALDHAQHRLLIAAMLAALSTPSLSNAATWFWPDLVFAGPCSGSLQACIGRAGDGDSIVIVADEVSNPSRYTLIDENLTISRSVNLWWPRVSTPCWRRSNDLRGLTTNAAHTVRISDLNLRRGAIRVSEPSNVNGGVLEFSRASACSTSAHRPRLRVDVASK